MQTCMLVNTHLISDGGAAAGEVPETYQERLRCSTLGRGLERQQPFSLYRATLKCRLQRGTIFSTLNPPPKGQTWDHIGLVKFVSVHHLGEAMGPSRTQLILLSPGILWLLGGQPHTPPAAAQRNFGGGHWAITYTATSSGQLLRICGHKVSGG